MKRVAILDTHEIGEIVVNSAVEDEIDVEEEAGGDDSGTHVEFEIATYPSDLTLSVIHEMYKEKDITIPAFQRNFVWNIRQSSLLIESFLLGLPVPQVFFYIDDECGPACKRDPVSGVIGV